MADHAGDFRLAVWLSKQKHAGIETPVMENRMRFKNTLEFIGAPAQKVLFVHQFCVNHVPKEDKAAP